MLRKIGSIVTMALVFSASAHSAGAEQTLPSCAFDRTSSLTATDIGRKFTERLLTGDLQGAAGLIRPEAKIYDLNTGEVISATSLFVEAQRTSLEGMPAPVVAGALSGGKSVTLKVTLGDQMFLTSFLTDAGCIIAMSQAG